MATNFIMQPRRATLEEWEESGIIPEEGELVLEDCENGTFKIKIGNGTMKFAELPDYMVAQIT